MEKRITVLLILILLFLITSHKSMAQSQISLISDKEEIKKDEEINIIIDLNNIDVASFTLEIYWDESKLKYISGPENSNYSNNRVLYTWVNDKGVNTNDIVIDNFIFKALEDGSVNMVVTGELYNVSGDRIEVNNGNLQINIGENLTRTIQEEKEIDNDVADNNSNLRILRLDKEGISPVFDKNIKEYYFIADKTVTDLEVTAIPENDNATVTITGNKNLKIGKNVITIKVESKDKSKTSEYKIYVTRTDDQQKANANLETLAVRQGSLNPEFDANVNNYQVEVSSDVSEVELLAIPESQKATVSITGSSKLQVGDNRLQIVVLAEDKVTSKKYEITVHRRNQEEEIKEKEEQEEARKASCCYTRKPRK